MTAQELIDTIIMHYNGAPDDEVVTIGHWSKPEWAAPLTHFCPQIGTTLRELRAMATPRALVASSQLVALRRDRIEERFW